jgi:hypothetical protein
MVLTESDGATVSSTGSRVRLRVLASPRCVEARLPCVRAAREADKGRAVLTSEAQE